MGQTNEHTSKPLGMVAYADGSFRMRKAGWGVHGYIYVMGSSVDAESLFEKAKADGFKGVLRGWVGLYTGGEKQLPTEKGYAEVEINDTVEIVKYFDNYASIAPDRRMTNNVAELKAVVECFRLATETGVDRLLIYTDSQYVQMNLYKKLEDWHANNYVKSDGEPVKNVNLWKELRQAKLTWLEAGKGLDVVWVKGHSGNRGNDNADANALLSTVFHTEPKYAEYDSVVHPQKLPEVNPLFLRSRLLFDAHKEPELDGNYYCMYSLGRAHNYGHKQHDSTLEKIAKTDIILGRRLSEACYTVVKLPEKDDYLENIKDNHRREHPVTYSQPAVIRLDNIFTPVVRKRYAEIGDVSLANVKSIQATVRHDFVPVSKTLSPPRQTYEAISLFTVLKQQLDDYINGTLGKSIQVVDITEQLYETIQEGKKKPVTRLLSTITQNTPFLTFPCVIGGKEVTLRVVLGLDIPVRNSLAKLAEHKPKVSILVSANGPLSYSFNTVLDTVIGTQIFSCPYTQFVLPKK